MLFTGIKEAERANLVVAGNSRFLIRAKVALHIKRSQQIMKISLACRLPHFQ